MEITLPSGRRIYESSDVNDPFIIAEVGSNFSSKEDCINSIGLAKACGASAVKFQAYNREALYGPGNITIEGNLASQGPYKRIDDVGELPVSWLPDLKQKADAFGLEFMCSAFSPALLDEVNPHVNIHKLASAEMTHVRMLQKLAKLGKPVIMSTGASGQADIEKALLILKDVPVVLLYCVAAYPAREVHLGVIHALRERFGTLVGFSDHTLDVLTIPRLAHRMGASVIEKHVNFVGAKSPDAGHSLSTDQFKRMVESIKYACDPGSMSIGYTGEETPMILRHNRRLIAIKDIKPGDTFTEDANFGIYRSLVDDTRGLSPFAIDKVLGRAATREIKAGESIGPGDFV